MPTTDPDKALWGVIPTIGGYKGTNLALMMNVLAGILAGSAHSVDVANTGKRGQFFLLLSPALFGDPYAFLDEVEHMCTLVKGGEPLPGIEEVFLPGEIEQRQREARLRAGTIPYPRSVVHALEEVGRATGIELPRG